MFIRLFIQIHIFIQYILSSPLGSWILCSQDLKFCTPSLISATHTQTHLCLVHASKSWLNCHSSGTFSLPPEGWVRYVTYYSTEQTLLWLVVYFTVFFLCNTVRNLRTRTGSFLFRPASMDRETDLAQAAGTQKQCQINECQKEKGLKNASDRDCALSKLLAWWEEELPCLWGGICARPLLYYGSTEGWMTHCARKGWDLTSALRSLQSDFTQQTYITCACAWQHTECRLSQSEPLASVPPRPLTSMNIIPGFCRSRSFLWIQ